MKVEFVVKPDITYQPEPRYFIYDNAFQHQRLAELVIPESKKKAPTLRIKRKAVYDVLSRYPEEETEISMDTTYTFVTPKMGEFLTDYLNELSKFVSTFLGEYRAKQKYWGFRVIFSVPISRELQVNSEYSYNTAWEQALPKTVKNKHTEIQFENDRLRAVLYFEDNCITLQHTRALQFFADVVKFLFKGDDIMKLYDKIEEAAGSMEKHKLEPGCYLDEDSWIVFEVFDGRESV